MTAKDFVKATIEDLSQPIFEELKMLLGDFISFSILDSNFVPLNVYAEKVCDYFEKYELKTVRSFDRCISTYLNELNDIVEPHIAKVPPVKKGEKNPVPVFRARKYYEKVAKTKDTRKPSLNAVLDYSRIMMCLYSAVLKSNDGPIMNFNYSANCIKPKEILESMKKEEVPGMIPNTKKKRLETKDLYSADVCTLILSTLVLCSIVNTTFEGDADHE